MRTTLMTRIVAAVALLSLFLMPSLALVSPASAAHDPTHMAMQIDVSYKGFNDDHDFEVVVQQGQQVELTFVWADTSVPDNAHRVLIKGYGVKTKLLDVDQREDTISFVADQPGVFEIVCDWRCEGHKTLAARLKVIGAGGAGAALVSGTATSSPATLEVAPASQPTSSGAIAIGISLKDADGAFVSDAQVRFFRPTSFAGVEAEVAVGQALTDEHGTATFSYRPTTAGEQTLVARFAGAGPAGPAEHVINFNVATAHPAYEQEAKGLQLLRHTAPYAGALAIAFIWMTFGYVLWQAATIRRDP